MSCRKAPRAIDQNLLAGHAHGAGDGYRERRDSAGVAFGFRVFQVERVAQSLQGNVVGALQIGHGSLKLIGAGLHQRFQIGLIGAVLYLETAILEGPSDRIEQLFALEGLEQIVVGAVADSGERDGNVVDGSNHHDRHVRKFFLGAFEQADAVEIGHHQIGKH